MWPMNGRYQCRRCLLYHRIPWEQHPLGGRLTQEFSAQTRDHRAIYQVFMRAMK